MNTSFESLYLEAKNQPTAAQQFINEVAALTHKTEATVRNWISGRQNPDDLTKNVLAEHFHLSPEVLFPNSVKQ
ncbi:MAG: helix-turn-helix domain-containing protein [Bacteroidales bacterium]|nr:helix-turn-helix domain-containing protein [Bacteroidales bacterium]